MIELGKQSRQSGVFDIAPNKQVNGTLTLDGRRTSLYLWSEELPDIFLNKPIVGTMDDLKRVSLLGCNIRSQRHTGRREKLIHKIILSPQCAIFGDSHISDKDEVVLEVVFSVEHATALFNDTDAYGTVFANPKAIEGLLQIKNAPRNVAVEDWNWIAYYTGKTTIFSIDTEIGVVSAEHSPILSVGIASNTGLEKKARISIKFDSPVTVVEALYRMGRAVQFFDILVGYRQNVSEISIHTGHDHPSHSFDVYSTNYAEHDVSHEEKEPSTLTILLDPVQSSDVLSCVLQAWLKKDVTWCAARMRLAQDWGKKAYDYDRIIAAANVFDLVPGGVYGASRPLAQDFGDAIAQARQIFRKLPQSGDRDRLLGCFGSVGGWTLKKKIRHRAKRITNVIGGLLPEIDVVIDEAVNLRNFYVHGTPCGVSSSKPLRFLSFLSSSLEFIFFASDLVDAGWNIAEWCAKGKPLGHPFHNYLVNYEENLGVLKKAVER